MKGMCSADPECTPQSCISKSEALVLVDLTTKSAKNLVVQPPAIVGLGLCSQLFTLSLTTLLSLRWNLRVETGWSNLPKSRLRSNCLWLPREACFDLARWFRIGAKRVATVLVRPASVLNCTVTDCGSHVKLVLVLSDCADFDACFFLVFWEEGTARCWE